MGLKIPDALYGCLPAPFFVISGRLSPDLLMEEVPTPLFFVVGLLCALGGFAVGLYSGFLGEAVIPVAVHWLIFFAHALPWRNEKYFDLAGQLAFSSAAIWSLARSQLSWRQLMVTVLCVIWSVRLGGFLFLRMLERKSDFRFVKARKFPGYLFFAWTW